MREDIRWLLISVVIVTVLIGSLSLMGQTPAPSGFLSFSKITGQVIGLPDCRASMKISVPESVEISPGVESTIEITVSDVKCGVTQASLEITGLPKNYYTVTPAKQVTLSPVKSAYYVVKVKAPETDSGMFYTAKVRIYTITSSFYSSEFTVQVSDMPEKPAVTAGVPKIENIAEAEEISGGSGSFFTPVHIIQMILVGLTLVAIVLVIYVYLPKYV